MKTNDSKFIYYWYSPRGINTGGWRLGEIVKEGPKWITIHDVGFGQRRRLRKKWVSIKRVASVAPLRLA